MFVYAWWKIHIYSGCSRVQMDLIEIRGPLIKETQVVLSVCFWHRRWLQFPGLIFCPLVFHFLRSSTSVPFFWGVPLVFHFLRSSIRIAGFFGFSCRLFDTGWWRFYGRKSQLYNIRQFFLKVFCNTHYGIIIWHLWGCKMIKFQNWEGWESLNTCIVKCMRTTLLVLIWVIRLTFLLSCLCFFFTAKTNKKKILNRISCHNSLNVSKIWFQISTSFPELSSPLYCFQLLSSLPSLLS